MMQAYHCDMRLQTFCFPLSRGESLNFFMRKIYYEENLINKLKAYSLYLITQQTGIVRFHSSMHKWVLTPSLNPKYDAIE